MNCDFELACCDNLEFMDTINSNSIDLIYCGVLYGTGKKFKDYQDINSNKDVVFSFYTQRLLKMYDLLKNTGSIYLQMDIRINHWLRCIMDEIFGYSNFRNQITVKYNIGGRGKREFAKKHDIIIVYSKSDEFIFNDMDIRVPYKSVISKSIDKPNITPEKLAIGTIPTNVWDDIPSALKVKKQTDYYSEKHIKILERIIKASSNEGDLVADFFLGSGTTAYAALKNNRKFIVCDINPRSIDVTKKRCSGF